MKERGPTDCTSSSVHLKGGCLEVGGALGERSDTPEDAVHFAPSGLDNSDLFFFFFRSQKVPPLSGNQTGHLKGPLGWVTG